MPSAIDVVMRTSCPIVILVSPQPTAQNPSAGLFEVGLQRLQQANTERQTDKPRYTHSTVRTIVAPPFTLNRTETHFTRVKNGVGPPPWLRCFG